MQDRFAVSFGTLSIYIYIYIYSIAQKIFLFLSLIFSFRHRAFIPDPGLSISKVESGYDRITQILPDHIIHIMILYILYKEQGFSIKCSYAHKSTL